MANFADLVTAFEQSEGNPFAGKLFVARAGDTPAAWTGRNAFNPAPAADVSVTGLDSPSLSLTGAADASLSMTGAHVVPPFKPAPVPRTFAELLTLAALTPDTEGILVVQMDNPDQPATSRRRIYMVHATYPPDTRNLFQLLLRRPRPIADDVIVRAFTGPVDGPYSSFRSGAYDRRSIERTIEWIPARAGQGYIPVEMHGLAEFFALIAKQ